MIAKFIISLLAGAAVLLAQGTVTIFGTVTDATGAAVPSVQITVTHKATGAVRQLKTDGTGNYVASQLAAGLYQLRAENSGFKTFILDNIETQVDENRRVDIQLAVGEVTERVEVTAEAAQVETRSGSIREVIDSKRIEGLPLNGRNPLQLQYLVAGSGARGARDQAQNETVSINGSRTNSNNYQLDGGDNHDPYFNSPAIFPSPDALEEFSIQTNSYGADRGRNAGAFMTAVTKSGTNEWHGSAFEFLRNEKLNARNFFSNTVPPFRRNQFGGTFGGRIVRDKTFFFLSYQGTIERSAPGAVTATVPTAEQRRGDYSALTRPVRDPLVGNFPGNIIPPSRLNAASQKFLEALVPLPNRPNGLLSTSSQQKTDDHQGVAKVDHSFSSNHLLNARLLRNSNIFREATGNLPGFFADIDYQNWSIAAGDTYIFTPSLINSFNFSYSDIDRRQLSVVPGDANWIKFGAGFTRAFSVEAPSGMHTLVDGYFNAFSRFPLNHFRKNIQFSNMVSWTKGAHLLKFGGDVRRSILNLQELFRGDPYVRFGNTQTGEAMADMVLGLPFQYEQIAEAANRPRVTEMGFFTQDDWKVNRQLTLNLGVRWDPWFPFIDELDKFAQVWPGVQSTVFPTAPRGVVFPGDAGTTRSMLNTAWGNVAPRFGFAYDPTGQGRTSIRGGYGMFFSQVRQQANNQISTNQPFSIKLTVSTPAGGINDPYRGVGNPFPFTAPTNAQEAANYKWLTPLTITQWNSDFRNAVIQQWNFNLQRQVGSSWILTGAYVGSKGNHLFMASEVNPGIYRTTGNLNQRRPLFPIFANVTDQSSRGNSVYHAMQLSLNKRFTRGFTILANYTWSKLIDDSSGDGDVPANPFNFRNERGPSDLDITHRVTASFIWELPKFSASPAVVKHVFGGWETNGILTFESGRWLNFTSGRDNSGSGVNGDRADLIGDPYLDTSRPHGDLVQRYFNTAAFAQNPAGTFGTSGRNILRGPGQATIDFGAIKNFAITEKVRLQFRAEFFNLLNRVNLGNPNQNQSSAQFGVITSAGAPRVAQMALRLRF